ncbi:MAG TPA: undecaprenyl-diphosphate phosphatase, partial [Xanthomonadaceae bacterium]|nr:undecaprenyl-diphosphate phosphatase [Xanthomonadaceae bacterium]
MPATPLAAADLLAALLLGIIEGITEFLPISSTGHLLIAEHWLGHRSDLFNIAIQAGAILAVVLIYRRRLWELAGAFLGRRALATPSTSAAAVGGLSDPLPAGPLPDAQSARDYGWKLLGAFLVTAVLGVAVKQAGFALPERIEPIAWALVIGGIWM